MSVQERQALFYRWAAGYDRQFVSDSSSFPFAGYHQLLDTLLAQAEVRPGMVVLELGIGTGNLAQLFLEAGCRVCAGVFLLQPPVS